MVTTARVLLPTHVADEEAEARGVRIPAPRQQAAALSLLPPGAAPGPPLCGPGAATSSGAVTWGLPRKQAWELEATSHGPTRTRLHPGSRGRMDAQVSSPPGCIQSLKGHQLFPMTSPSRWHLVNCTAVFCCVHQRGHFLISMSPSALRDDSHAALGQRQEVEEKA